MTVLAPAKKKYLVLTSDQIVVGPGPNGDVMAEILAPEQDTGLLGIGLILRMTPTEARAFADLLNRKADAAEAGSPRS